MADLGDTPGAERTNQDTETRVLGLHSGLVVGLALWHEFVHALWHNVCTCLTPLPIPISGSRCCDLDLGSNDPLGTGFLWPKKKNRAPVPLKRFLCGGRALA
eukprot:3931744-Lingulodinium_polyedra.AAC.1